MRSIDARNQVPTVTPALESEALDRIVAGIHDMIAGFRCAGTGRLVKAGVSMTHMHVMWLLQHHGDLSMSRLAELLDVTPEDRVVLTTRGRLLSNELFGRLV